MASRAFAVVGAGIGATVLAAAGITYASTVESSPASPPVHRAAQPLHHPAQPAHHITQSAQHAASANSAASAASAAAPSGAKDGGESGKGGRDGGGRDGGRDRDGGGGRDRGRGHGHGEGHRRAGRIFINERSYRASIDGCITVASGLGAHSFNVRNESRRTVEIFRGVNCDGGPPIATVGPRSETFGVRPHRHDGGFARHGVVGSFRVVCDHDEW